MPSLQVDAVLFDMDGTLIDESASYREAIRLTSEYILGQDVSMAEVIQVKDVPGFNNDWDAAWGVIEKRLHGRMVVPNDSHRASQTYLRLRNAFQTYYLGDKCWHEMSGAEPPFAWSEPLMMRETALIGAETLRSLSSFALGIATSRPRVEALMAARQHGLDRFFDGASIVAAEDAPFQKPHPAPLEVLVSRLGCRCPVYVGDSVNDAIAAAAAGMPCVAVGSDPFTSSESEASVFARIGSVDEIGDIVVASERCVHD